MTSALFALAAMCWVFGSYLLVTSWQRRRPTLFERLEPYRPTPLADEIERWLRNEHSS